MQVDYGLLPYAESASTAAEPTPALRRAPPEVSLQRLGELVAAIDAALLLPRAFGPPDIWCAWHGLPCVCVRVLACECMRARAMCHAAGGSTPSAPGVWSGCARASASG